MPGSGGTLVGGMLCTSTAIPSADGSELYIASSRDVRTYSCVTGDRLAQLAGHSANVTAVCRDPENEGTVLTACVDGRISRWRTADQKCLSTSKKREPIMGMVLVGKGMAIVSTSWREGQAGRVWRCHLDSEEWRAVLRLNTPGTDLAVSPSQDFVATFERNTVHCIKPHHPDVLAFRMHHTRHITCVAFDSTNTHIAAGDVSGRIIIWTGLEAASTAAENGSLPQDGNAGMSIATIHWHANPVAALCFSQDGRYLLSGGEEAVLVVWQLLTLKRTYLPRLGGPISHIVCVPEDPTKYIIGQQNNVVRIVSLAAMEVECSVYGVRPAPATASPQDANQGITLQPGSGYAVLPSAGAQLQFYDLARDCHVAKLQVFPRNVIAQSTGEASVEPIVIHAVFTADATTLVTVESHPAVSGMSSGRWHALKFWDVENAGSSNTVYTVNSVVNDPHFGHIMSVACDPHRSIIATTSIQPSKGTGELRIWAKHHFKRVPGAQSGSPTWHWHCKSSGTHKGEPMHTVTFSADGSLVAVGTACGVALFDPESCTSSAFLASPFPLKPKKVHFAHACFLPGSAFLAAAQVGGHGGGICVWNLLTLTPWWIAEGHVRDLCAHPSKALLAAVIGGNENAWGVMEVDVSCGKIESWWEQRSDRVARVLYAPSHSALCSKLQQNSVLLVISEARQIMILREKDTKVMELASLDVAHVKDRVTLRNIFGAHEETGSGARANKSATYEVPARRTIDHRLLYADSHLLPAPPELCSSMLQSFLVEGIE